MTHVEVSDLRIVGKVFPDTPNPYERMDFTKFDGWTAKTLTCSKCQPVLSSPSKQTPDNLGDAELRDKPIHGLQASRPRLRPLYQEK